ncbi:PREDICTED: TNF receptor-associated factor 3 isoform X1 [Bactrocera latifrons]|uniref:TNF receptor-associated factor 3 n=2 Tax=Bactrocera latifrons TaxID=174628 RepID=A0A0K8V666_BACLA|nr:PREDICTED: TNF receptor-associated factor 3 isoform X1 [Bactrocera latifrons]
MATNGNGYSRNSNGALSSNGTTTVLKYEKSSCLFCNEWFDSQTFTEHLIHCGQVLEQCPNSCNAFVPRIRMRTHLKECPRAKAQPQQSNSLERLDQFMDNRINQLEKDLSALRSVLNEEIGQRLHLITDVGNLRKYNQVLEDWKHEADESVRGVKALLNEEIVQRQFEVGEAYKDNVANFEMIKKVKADIQGEMDVLQKNIQQLSLEVAEHVNHLNDNTMKLEEMILENEKKNLDKFIEIEEFLNVLDGDLKTKFVANSDLNAKQANMDLEVKSMKNIVCETEERCEKLEGIVNEIDTKLHQTMQTLADLENHLATQQRLTSIQNTRGHLIWRIKDFSKKLEEAKQYETILHSAMFSNKPYGYALRLDIHPNGKGTWKGRNLIACLNVIAGEYDALLSWPCRLQADIIIRAQFNNAEESQDYVKTILVRKKNDEFIQNNQYFHIPHKIVTNTNFLRNDSLYVEVRVLK